MEGWYLKKKELDKGENETNLKNDRKERGWF